MPLRAIPACALALLALGPGLAQGERGSPVARARALDDLAAELYAAGEFEAALERMRAAQELVPATARLYNMARAEEEAGDREAAAELYRAFVAAEDAPADRRTRAVLRLEALAAAEREGPPPEPEAPPAGETTPAEPAPAGAAEAPEPEPPAAEVGLAPAAFWAAVGLTAASAVALAALGGVALALEDELLTLHREDDRAYEIEDRGNAVVLGANVMIGLTAGAAATAVLLALFTRFGGAPPVVAAAPGRSGPALALAWGF